MLWLVCLMTFANLEQEVMSRLQTAKTQGSFEAVFSADFKRARVLFARTLTRQPDVHLRRDWSDLGFRLEPKGDVWLLQQIRNRGGGVYAFQYGADTIDAALQIPHGYFDLHTGLIGAKLAAEGRFRVTAWNTVHRKKTALGLDRDSDLAHMSQSYLQALTSAWADVAPTRPIIQLHGFANRKREDLNAKRAALILSDGARQPSTATADLAACLHHLWIGRVVLFGRDTAELGGLTNSQNLLLRRLNRGRFLHLELNLELRERLRIDARARGRLIECLGRR